MPGIATDIDLSQAISELRAKRLSPLDLWHRAEEAHRTRSPVFDAYKTWNDQHGRAAAEAADRAFRAGLDLGALQGIPVSAKDLFGVAGLPTYAGSPRPLPSAWEREGGIIRAVRSQLAPVSGKTHTVQFAFGGIGTCEHQPTPRNPWDADTPRVPGGSSAGAAISLHEGSALLALGTDTGGSVRIPASLGGVVGLKTTAGRWPRDGIVPLSRIYDSPGLLCHSVEDAILVFRTLEASMGLASPQGVEFRGANLRQFSIGVPDAVFWDQCSPGIVKVVKDTIDEVSRRGLRVSATELPEAADAYEIFRQGATSGAELFAFLNAELRDWLDLLDPKVKARVDGGRALGATEFLERVARLDILGRAVHERLSEVDAFACPTVAITPPPLTAVEDADDYREWNMAILRNTSIVNLLGLCAVTLPAGLDSAGMPVGLQLIGRANDEAHLLALARLIEQVIGKPRHRIGKPPLVAALAT